MAGRARAVPVRMTIKRRRKLEQIIAAGTSPQRLVLRARIVLAAAEGKENAQIARDLGCSIDTARTWRGRFAVHGIPGIFDRPRSGRPETHGPSARLAIVATVTSVPPTASPPGRIDARPPPARTRPGASRGLPSDGRSPTRTSGRTRSGAGSTAPTTRPSGPAPARSAASTWTRRPAPC